MNIYSKRINIVISELAERALGKKNRIVSYRNSALTRILQKKLGGNSKTFMLCTISPASDCYEETLSTLRFGDQAIRVQNKPMINSF
jgi:predicted solute-binding protein